MKSIRAYFSSLNYPAARDIQVLLVLFSCSFFLFLGRGGLIEPDEGRYSEIPREMLEKGDFITPTLNYVHYFEKPPLHYWLTALSFKLFGLNEFAARFTGALAGLLTVLLIYHTARKLFDRRAAILSAFILGLSTGFTVQSRVNLTDMTLTFFLSASLCCFIIATIEHEKNKRLYHNLFFLFSALAVLTKGLIGMVLPMGIIGLYLLFCRQWRLLKEMRLGSGCLIFLLIAAPWFILVSQRNPGFARFFFIHEHLQRYLTTVHGRFQPFWYFVPILLLIMLPWSFYIVRATWNVFKERCSPTGDRLLYLVLWAAIVFLFFSASQSKLIPYILPVIPALAMLVGKLFSDQLEKTGESLFVIEHFILVAVLSIMAVLIALYPHAREFGPLIAETGLVRPNSSLLTKLPLISPMGGTLFAFLALAMALTAWIACRKKDLIALFVGLGICSYSLEIAGQPLFREGIEARKSYRELALVARSFASAGSRVASFGYDQSLPFYTGTRTIVVGSKGELDFGSNQGNQSAWFINEDEFLKLWQGDEQIVVLLQKGEYELVAARLKPNAIPLAEKGKKILITNRVNQNSDNVHHPQPL
ncbi:MAG: glycosyltransferase family 39 protein [Desulfuromonadales bacterium]|nr:glycosyltransferase family 39 protein [Desulfuromonadales bacterium]